jgi:hypothetical protein
MNRKQKKLIELLNNAIHKKTSSDLNFKNVDWKYIIKESVEHNIYSLLYPVIKETSPSHSISNELKKKWKQDTFKTAIFCNCQITQMAKVFKKFNEQNIPVIALKGLILRNLYPAPDLRTMCDSDILIHEEDMKKVEVLLTEMDYKQVEDNSPIHTTFIHKYYNPIEVHFKVADSLFIHDISHFENNVWNCLVTKKFNDTTVLCFCTEDFLVHLCIHMATHMRYGGFGLRQFCDFVLLIEKEGSSIDWKSFNTKIKSNSIEKFTMAIFSVCNSLFNVHIPKELNNVSIDEKYIKMLIHDIFASGVYGGKSLDRIFGNAPITPNPKSENKSNIVMIKLINIIFPPINTLSSAYSYAKKYKILTPIAWIHHFFAGAFNKEYNVIDKIKIILFSDFTFKKRSKLIKGLGL